MPFDPSQPFERIKESEDATSDWGSVRTFLTQAYGQFPMLENMAIMSASVRESLFNKRPNEDFVDAFSENFHSIKSNHDKEKEKASNTSPIAAKTGKIFGNTAALTVPAVVGPVTTTVTVLADAMEKSVEKSMANDLDFNETTKQLAVDSLWTGSTIGGMAYAFKVVPEALQTLGTVSKEGAKKLYTKFLKLEKLVRDKKITEKQALNAAEEALKTNTFIPSIRKIDAAVTKELQKMPNKLNPIYKEAADTIKNKQPVNFREMPSKLRSEADSAASAGDFQYADDLKTLADKAEEYLPKVDDIQHAWTIVKNFGKNARSKTGDISKEAVEKSREIAKQSLDQALASHLPSDSNLIQRLSEANQKAHNLFIASRGVSKEAAKASSSLVPTATETAVFAASAGGSALGVPLAPVFSTAVGLKYAGRVGHNLIPGVVGKAAYKTSAAANTLGKFAPLSTPTLRAVSYGDESEE